LLQQSGARERVEGRKGGLIFFNLAVLGDPELAAEARQQVVEVFQCQDAVLLVSEENRAATNQLADNDVPLFDVTHPIVPEHSAAIPSNIELGPRTIRSVYTGIIPLVFKTQRQLLISLQQSITWATVLIAGVMAIVFRSALAGLIAMLPNVFPIFLVFGTLGWIGMKIDIGIMMTASVALGVAVDNTVHLVTWFRDAQRHGHDRRTAVLMAYDRCATAMAQTALVGGLGLVVFAFSTFTPTQQFGYLMITILIAALIGDLVMLPALLCSPLGKCFECAPVIPAGPGAGTGTPVHAATPPLARRESTAPTAAAGSPAENPYVVPTADDDGLPNAADKLRSDEPLASPANAALHAKLRSFRRPTPQDPRGSR
jgi:hypothetical protein